MPKPASKKQKPKPARPAPKGFPKGAVKAGKGY